MGQPLAGLGAEIGAAIEEVIVAWQFLSTEPWAFLFAQFTEALKNGQLRPDNTFGM
jgi:hypothetical protein